MSLSSSPLHIPRSFSVFGTFSQPSSLLGTTAFPVLLAAATPSNNNSDDPHNNNNNNKDDDITSTTNDNHDNVEPVSVRESPSHLDDSTPLENTTAPLTQHTIVHEEEEKLHQSNTMDNIKKLVTLPRPRAILYMSIAMALHFGGYEFVRSTMLALFTSNDVGFSNPSAFPLAMGLVSPFSVVLLYGYGKILEKEGPRAALRNTSLFSLLIFAAAAFILKVIQQGQPATTATTTAMAAFSVPISVMVSRAMVALAFIFTNSYAHLLYTQHWSFLSSVMTPEEGSVWFASIAGTSSIMCTITGTMVKPLVNTIGLIGTISINCLFLLVSVIFADRAYRLSEDHGFDPAVVRKQQQQQQQQQQKKSEAEAAKQTQEEPGKTTSLFWKAKDLFQRVPTLGALFGEVLTFQSLSVILNTAMVTRLKVTMPADAERAAWTGQFFAAVSAVSSGLQFIIIPLFLKRIEPQLVWKVMPIIPFMCSLFQSFQGSNAALAILALSFFATKTMDYSIRGVMNEMVYQPLDFDSRYLGKEIIAVFGSRFGKSGVSLILSYLAFVFPSGGVSLLSKLSVVASLGWLAMTWWLSHLVPKKAEAQEAFLEQRRPATTQPSATGNKDKEE